MLKTGVVAAVSLAVTAGIFGIRPVVAAPPLDVFAGDVPVVVSGPMGTTLVGEFRVFPRGDLTGLQIIPGRLARDGDNSTGILPSSVTTSLGPDLGGFRTITVSVTAVPKAGTYAGKLWLKLATEGIDQAVTVDLTVQATSASIALRAGQRVQVQLVRCASLECDLSSLALPGSNPTSWAAMLENSGSADGVVTSVVTDVRGQKSHGSLGGTLTLGSTPSIPSQGVGPLNLAVTKVNVAPDHYTGDVLIGVAGASAPLVLPVELDVRDGPLLPLAALLIAIGAGILSRWNAGFGGQLADAYERLQGLRRRIAAEPQPDRDALMPRLTLAAALLGEGNVAELTPELDRIDKWRKLLPKVRRAEALLNGAPRDPDGKVSPDVLAALAKCARIRPMASDVDVDRYQTADNLYLEAKAVADLQPPRYTTRERGDLSAGSLSRPLDLTGEGRAILALLLRRAVYVVGLVVLAVIGLNELWVAKPTFGSGGVVDYGTLIAWGFGSEKVVGALTKPKTGV